MMPLRIAGAALCLLVAGCGFVTGESNDAAAAACRLLGEATQQQDPNEMMFGLAEAQRTASNNGETELADQLDVLANALRSGDTYRMGTAAIDVNNTCREAGVDIDEEFS